MIGRWGLAALLATATLRGGAAAQAEPPAAPATAAIQSKHAQAIERQERLDRRARELEALAADPPLPPPGLSDGPQDSGEVMLLKSERWRVQLKREAAEARAVAEAARPKPDRRKVGVLRKRAARYRAEED